MNFEMIPNPKWTEEQRDKFTKKVIDNDGYCPCMLIKNKDTMCICRDFAEKLEDDTFTGLCHCGRYLKKEID